MIGLDGADAYFNGRTAGAQWLAYSDGQRTAAIADARRQLARALGRALADDEPPYAEGDRTRDEFAVYEQALYLLVRDALPKGDGSAVPSLNPDEARPPRETMSRGRDPFSREALAWLGEVRMPRVVMA